MLPSVARFDGIGLGSEGIEREEFGDEEVSVYNFVGGRGVLIGDEGDIEEAREIFEGAEVESEFLVDSEIGEGADSFE